MNGLLLFLVAVGAFVADRLGKMWATSFLSEHGATRINSLLTIRETYNRGLALGLLQGLGPLVGWLSILILVGLSFYVVRLPPQERLTRIGLAMIIGGALGNLVDRITSGQVLDFIQTPLLPGVFNVADIMINVGMVLILAGALLQRGQPQVIGHEDSPLP